MTSILKAPRSIVAALIVLAVSASQGVMAAPPATLTIGVAQLALEPTLAANRDKIIRFVKEAKSRGCRVVVFPETALFGPDGTSPTEIDSAVDSIRRVVDASDVYALVGGLYRRHDKDKSFERLMVVGPDGVVLQEYRKMWQDARFNDGPGSFEIDGVPCAAALCADRWIRSVEDLPAIAGAKILFECSNNYANEWLRELGHYWYVPRAIRNSTFVVFANTAAEDRGQKTPGHGHSAVIRPDGKIIAAAEEESDRLLVTELDLTQATNAEATLRRAHPALGSFWETGVAMRSGQKVPEPEFKPLLSGKGPIKIAAAQMGCSRSIEENVDRIVELTREAAANGADVVVFPELAVTGAQDEDLIAAKETDLRAALHRIQAAAAESKIHVVVGLPGYDSGRRFNTAVVIGPKGELLTRYAQLAVDRAGLFSAGTSTRTMWFEIKNVPCVVTIGHDALWSELAEMAAWRGAQVHLHLSYANDQTPLAATQRQQRWANIASFRTFTATVNAASPKGLPAPSAPASGGSAIWEDFHRAASGKAGGYAPHSAVRLASANAKPQILYASQAIPKTNPQFQILTEKTNRPMRAWYVAGANAIFADATTSRPYVNGHFQGRIAYSADGNHNDPDDWAASPVALAILAEAGLRDRIVHFDYNCILPQTNPEWEKTHAESVLGAARHYQYDSAIFFDCRKDLEAAISSLANAIDESSAQNPLYLIVAGPMEVPFLAIQRSQPEKRAHVYCISHSRWNDGFASKYQFTHTKRSVIETGVNWIQIRDQNRLLSLSPYGQPAPEQAFAGFFWMRDSNDEKLQFLWQRMLVSTRPDPSDAGMAYFLATGDEDADPQKLKRLLGDHNPPQPIAARQLIRLEAENFRDLGNYEIEDRNDRNTSHRLSVRPIDANQPALLRTPFDEPYTASGRYDVFVRYFDQPERRGRFSLQIGNAKPIEGEGDGTSAEWKTVVFPAIDAQPGDAIVLKVSGALPRLDYIELKQN